MKQAHQTFLIEMMKHGDKTRAYQKAYPNCTDAESARKSAERLLRNHPAIAAEIEEAAYSIQQRAYAEAYRLHAEERKTAILSMMDKRVILARIAKCEIKVCRYIKDGDRYRMLFEDPHPREIIRAIDADGRIEDRLNRARNLSDPKLSQFYIYIDGRPCDDPTAPINDQLPPGIVMLPRRTKKLIEEHGNNSEHFHTDNAHHTSPPPGDLGVLAQNETPIEEHGINLEQTCTVDTHNISPLQGPPGQTVRTGDLGVLAQEKSLIEEPGINLEQTCTVDTHNISPLQGPPGQTVRTGDLGVQLAQDKTPIREQGIISEHLSRQDGETTYLPQRLSDSAVQHSNDAQHCPPLGGDRGAFTPKKDLMSASFYEQQLLAEASAPPPHILTDEEVRQFHAEADRQLEEKKKQTKPSYNTFGKMYFPPEGRK